MENIEKAKLILNEEKLSLVLVNGDKVYKSEKSGVAPMLGFLSENLDLKGFAAADKIVGKASALLMLLGGITDVYAPVMSVKAEELFVRHGIDFSFDTAVDMIINRTGDGMCPMEETVMNIDSPEEAFTALKKKAAELKAQAN